MDRIVRFNEWLVTAVLHELQRRGAQVIYVHTEGDFDVDFLAHGINGEQTLIQVCAELDNPATLAREVRALQDAARTWPQAALPLITLSAPPAGAVPACVALHLVADWLLLQKSAGAV